MERALRDRLVDVMRQSGIDVVVDDAESQASAGCSQACRGDFQGDEKKKSDSEIATAQFF